MPNKSLDELNSTYVIPHPGEVGQNRPFTRVYANSYSNHPFLYRQDNAPRASGDGVWAGEHIPHEIPATNAPGIIGEAMNDLRKAVPSWVAVPYKPSVDRDHADIVSLPGSTYTSGDIEIEVEFVREVQGRLNKSKQSWTDFPAYQWHHWYDWNFHISPEPGFQYLWSIGSGADFECEWDTGVMGAHDGGDAHFNKAGPMYQADSDASNVRRDWCWPMTGGYIWLAGRWIYDGGHPEWGTGKYHSELHPCMAVATTRTEAVSFPAASDALMANRSSPSAAAEVLVPAVQFMFYANRLGGYKEFSADHFSEREFTFIVNLPPFPDSSGFSVGPDGPSMVIPREPILRVKIETDPFANAATPRGTSNPTVQLITTLENPATATAVSSNPERATRQALVTIPTSCLSGQSSYGVIVSLGWHNPDHTPGNRVYAVEVNVHSIAARGDSLIRFGINGRFFQRYMGGHDVRQFQHATTSLLLSESDEVTIQVGGLHSNWVGDWLWSHGRAERTLHVGGREIHWRDIEAAPDTEVAQPNGPPTVDQIASALEGLQWTTFGWENDDIDVDAHPRRHSIGQIVQAQDQTDWREIQQEHVYATADYRVRYSIKITKIPASGSSTSDDGSNS